MTPTNAATKSANRTSLLSWEAIAEPHVPDRGPPSIPPDRRPNISLRDAVKLGSYRKTSCTVVPHRQSEPSRLYVSHTGRDRLKLPPPPTLLRAGHLRRKPARPCDRPDRRPRNGAVASGPRPHVLEVRPARHQCPDVGDHP